jgi:hypothetical protein
MVENRKRKGPDCNNGIRDPGTRWQLRLRKKRASGRIFRKTVELEIEKQIVESLTELQEVTGHCGGTGPLRNERRDIKSTVLGKEGSSSTPVGYSG